MKVWADFYAEYEAMGETGVQFVREPGTNAAESFRLWSGHFETSMHGLYSLYWPDRRCNYVQILKEWNECTGFCDIAGDPSSIGDLPDTVRAFELLLTEWKSRDGSAKDIEILSRVVEFLRTSMRGNLTVSIEEL